MPIYNVEKYIERALLSALNQTYQNLEILIVDDLGHDNSMDIVYQLKSTHPRGNCIRIITHKKILVWEEQETQQLNLLKGNIYTLWIATMLLFLIALKLYIILFHTRK